MLIGTFSCEVRCEISFDIVSSDCKSHRIQQWCTAFVVSTMQLERLRLSACYVFAAAQFGRHNEKRESHGHSLAVDPWGRIVADAGGSDGPGTLDLQEPPSIIICDVDLDEMESIRARMPIQQHRDAASFSW